MSGSLPSRIVVATGNTGKLREIHEILAPWRVEVLPQSQFTAERAEETGLSFVENAILKARFAAAAAGLPAIADDSGLEVDALCGAPGIQSARYAGDQADDEANNRKLLQALAAVPSAARRARYRCAMVFMRSELDASPVVCQAGWEGRIAEAPAGSRGFGYDPLFFLDELGCTAAELDAAHKNRISHRGQALRALAGGLSGLAVR